MQIPRKKTPKATSRTKVSFIGSDLKMHNQSSLPKNPHKEQANERCKITTNKLIKKPKLIKYKPIYEREVQSNKEGIK